MNMQRYSNKAGVNVFVPISIKVCTKKNRGMDLTLSIKFQGREQINHLLQHGMAPHTVRNLLRIEL